ncbi:MAG: hypothetical protein U1E45_14905 [Geminicoccaceae bacterium]
MSWTPESLAEVPLRCVAHADGSATALWIYEADEPPISKLVTLNRRTGEKTIQWVAGGRTCHSLDEVVAALAQLELAL